MKTYTLSQVAEEFNISKDTLRYYDKINVLSPERGENQYRYYTEALVIRLVYIEIMKFAGFSLNEIKAVLVEGDMSEACRTRSIQLLQNKKRETEEKIKQLGQVTELLDVAIAQVKTESLENPKKSSKMNTLAKSIFHNIKSQQL